MARKQQTRPTRSQARNQRQQSRADKKNHEPLLRLVAEQEAQTQARPTPVKRDDRAYEPLTRNQLTYDTLIATKDLIFGLGVAGTGKTWWSVYRACQAFKAGEIQTIICTRPAVEAGESMGYLPGTLEEKFENYFRPVKAALNQFLGAGYVEYLIAHEKIQVRPLEFIRGETFKDCWVIADEMQNATISQHKTLLSRFGENCKMILNGDPEQIDLPRASMSGLMDAYHRMTGNPRTGAVYFEPDDIVRGGMCKDVILAYRKPASIAPNLSISTNAPLADDYIEHSEDDDAGLRTILRAG